MKLWEYHLMLMEVAQTRYSIEKEDLVRLGELRELFFGDNFLQGLPLRPNIHGEFIN